jgi:pSer/pThr/pTyr-binding forkhead associated (FHA) protein
MKCLQKKPEDRFGTAKELAQELRRFRAGQPTSAEISPPPEASVSPAVPSALLVNLTTHKQIRLPFGATIIGRAADCGIIVRASDVSKRHCQIVVDEDGAEVEDLESINGTAVNGQPVQRRRLQDGDHLDIAGHPFLFRIKARD